MAAGNTRPGHSSLQHQAPTPATGCSVPLFSPPHAPVLLTRVKWVWTLKHSLFTTSVWAHWSPPAWFDTTAMHYLGSGCQLQYFASKLAFCNSGNKALRWAIKHWMWGIKYKAQRAGAISSVCHCTDPGRCGFLLFGLTKQSKKRDSTWFPGPAGPAWVEALKIQPSFLTWVKQLTVSMQADLNSQCSQMMI